MAQQELPIGTRIYNHGDVANPEHFGTITDIRRSPRWGDEYVITPDPHEMYSGEMRTEPYTISLCAIDPVFKGHGGTRIVTEASYKAWRTARIADMQAQLVALKSAGN